MPAEKSASQAECRGSESRLPLFVWQGLTTIGGASEITELRPIMKVPKYRKHSSRDYAFVEYAGSRHRLPGKYDSPESRLAYHQFIERLLLEGEKSPPAGPDPLVLDLVVAFLEHAKTYYLQDGKPNKEFGQLRYACLPLVRLHGNTPVSRFGPKSLKEVRKAMVTGSWAKSGEDFGAWTRPHANHQVNRLRRVFRWGVEHELCQPAVLQALESVEPLRKGRTAAIEPDPVLPVSLETVEATLKHLGPVPKAMVRVQWLTGMRSDNLCMMRVMDIDTSRDVWLYVPAKHKNAWRERSLVIPLGKRTQKILRPFLDGKLPEDYVFQPPQRESRKKSPQRTPRKHYSPVSYYRAIVRACERAFGMPEDLRHIPQKPRKRDLKKNPSLSKTWPDERRKRLKLAKAWRKEYCWFPHQIRHAVATRVRQQYKLEGVQVYLGHAHADVSQIYAERDLDLALKIARELG